MASFIDVGETRYHYESAGTGETIVFLHHGISDMRAWDDQFSAFAQKYHVLRFDMRGYGQSSNPAGTYTDHEELAGLLDALKLDKIILVGASNGGRASIDFVLAYPERVKALALVGPGAGGYDIPAEVKAQWDEIGEAYNAGDLDKATELTARMWFDGPNRQPGDVDAAARVRAAQMMRDMYEIPEETDLGDTDEPDSMSRLEEIKTPTLVIQGADDVAYHLDLSKEIARRVPNGNYIEMANAAHFPMMEYPVQFNALLLAFIKDMLNG